MLVGMEGIDPKGRFYQTPSVFNYAKARGYTTALMLFGGVLIIRIMRAIHLQD
jgi:hypothetical protein